MASPNAMAGKKIRRHKKRSLYFDENAPKRPRTAYVQFINARRKQLADAGRYDLLRQRGLVVEIAKEWKTLTDEQKKPYFENSAKEQAEYEKAMEEYKKTEAYSQFQVKKEKLLEERMLELKKHKSAFKLNDDEVECEAGTATAGNIPIFSEEFLAYNKAQESRCKKLRHMVSVLQEEKDLLKADIVKLSERLNLLHEQQHETYWATKMKQRWAKLLVDALAYVSLDGEYPTLQNIDAYMKKLRKLVTEDPNSKDLIAVRMALSEVNFA